MLTPAYLRDAAEPVVDIFSQVESDISADIARRIVKAGYITETARYQLEKMQEIGLLQGDVQKILAEATGKSEKEIQRLMKEAGVEALKFDDSIYRKAGLTPPAIENSPIVKAVLMQGADKTKALINNFTKTAATTSKQAFSGVLDRCYLQILTGAYDRNTALKLAINDLAKKGIEKVAYPSGATSSTEAAVRRAVTTGLNQSVAKLQLARADEMGCELVETTSHAGARPTHAEWQGRVFCIKGHHPKYGDFYRETGYGEADGLCGINCYHSFFPYFEGLSVKGFSEDPAKEFLGKDNDEMYKEQQKQRYYERQIRAAKKECNVFSSAMNSATDPELKKAMQQQLLQSSDKLRRREAALNSFLADTGRTKDPSRVSVGGWSRNDMTTSKTKIAREAKAAAVPVKDYNALAKEAYSKENYGDRQREIRKLIDDMPVGSTITSKGVTYTKLEDGKFSYEWKAGKTTTTSANAISNGIDYFDASKAPKFEIAGSAVPEKASGAFEHKPFALEPTASTDLSRDAYEKAKIGLEKTAGREFTDKEVRDLVDSVYAYTTGEYVDILAADAGAGNPIYGEYYRIFLKNDPDRLAEAKQNAERVKTFLDNAPKYDGRVIRAMGFDINPEVGNDAWDRFESQLKVGGEIKFESFTSWTTSEYTAQQVFAHRTGLDEEAIEQISVFLEVKKSKTGVDIADYAEMSQHEVLFNNTAKFKVNSIERNSVEDHDGVTRTMVRVLMEEVL